MSKREAAQKNKMQERLEILTYIFWHLWKAMNENTFKRNARSEQWIVNFVINE